MGNFKEVITYTKGYFNSVPSLLMEDPSFAHANSRGILFTGAGKPQVYNGHYEADGALKGSPLMFTASDTYMGLGNLTTVGKGSLFSYIGKSLWAIGTGTIYRAGAKITSQVADGAITSGLAALTSATANWRADDVGASITINGAGAAGVNLTTTISAYTSPTAVTITANASTTVTGATTTWDWQAGTTLRFKIPSSAASYTNVGNVPLSAGLDAPLVASIAVSATASTKFLKGSKVSVRLTRVRKGTGCESNASVSSNVLTVTAGFKTDITIPSISTSTDGINGADQWGIYVTEIDKGTGETGPHYLYPYSTTSWYVDESTVVAASRVITLDWLDGDLLVDDAKLAPIENFPPPKGTHAFVLENTIAVVGCYNTANNSVVTASSPGSMIAVSKSGFPEAFPPTVNHLLALQEPPVHVLSRNADGYVYVLGKNSLTVCSYTGENPPIALRTLWANLGVADGNKACVVDNRLYLWTGQGPARMGTDGLPDFEFAARVSNSFSAIDPVTTPVCLGYDPVGQIFVIGTLTIAYSYNKAYDLWNCPVLGSDLGAPPGNPGYITSMFTHGSSTNQRLYMSIDDGGADYGIYTWNSTSASPTKSAWVLRSGHRTGGAPEFDKTIRTVNVVTGGNFCQPTIKIYRNQTVTAVATKAYNALDTHLPAWKPNVRNCKSYMIEAVGARTDDVIIGLQVQGEIREYRR